MNVEELEARLKALEDSVRTLQDIEEIKKLQRAYGYYLEHWQWEEIVPLFSDAPDTSAELAEGGVYVGKERIRGLFARQEVPREFLHVMMQLNGIVDVDPGGKTAKGRWYGFGCLALPEEGAVRALFSNGIYENEYVKEDGKWKFKKLHWHRIFFTPYEDGWVKTPVMARRRPDRPGPDRPTTVYEPYPSGYVTPFHYKNPVTGQ